MDLGGQGDGPRDAGARPFGFDDDVLDGLIQQPMVECLESDSYLFHMRVLRL
jgi:hypothetical protein